MRPSSTMNLWQRGACFVALRLGAATLVSVVGAPVIGSWKIIAICPPRSP